MGSLPRNDYASISAPTGPGQVERITILACDTNIATFTSNFIWLYIDDQGIFVGGIWSIGSIWQYAPVDGPYSGIHVGATGLDFTISEVYDYETSFRLTMLNVTSPDPMAFTFVLKGRVGR